MGDLNGALDDLERALKLEPGNMDACAARGVTRSDEMPLFYFPPVQALPPLSQPVADEWGLFGWTGFSKVTAMARKMISA